MQELVFLGQILLSIVLGGVLGWQRERLGKSAGPRTYGLVAAGATLFTLLAIHAFPGVTGAINIAAGIVTGVGFLGAGMIFHRDNHHVDNLTTAAGFWAMAAIGMAVGAGYYILGVGTTVIILAVFLFNERKYRDDQDSPAP